VTNNSAYYGGGGIYNNNVGVLTVSATTVSGCTVTGNVGSQGGGIYNAGSLTVSNSFFTSNTPDNIYGTYTDGGGNTFK
jgi:hypothetical protein